MRTFFFLFLAACSNNNPVADGGTDAAPDVATNDTGTTDAPVTDSGGCFTASATINGTFLGKTLTPKDAVSFQTHTNQYEVVVGVVDYTGICGLGNDQKANSNAFAIIYQGAQPLAPAKIDISQTNTLFAQYTQFDGTCGSPQGESASSGTITFTQVDACGVVGSFDLMFNTDHVTGTFNAPACTAAPDGGPGGCKP